MTPPSNTPRATRDPWHNAVLALAAWKPGARWDAGSPNPRGVDQHVGRAAVQNWSRLDAALGLLLERPARGIVRGILLAAGAEILLAPQRTPAIVHAAVERGRKLVSPREAGFLNAVLRRLPDALGRTNGDPATPEGAAARFSHPLWLVQRWWERLGPDATRALLAWNQDAPVAYLRIDRGGIPPPELVEATVHRGVFRVRPGADWTHLAAGLRDGRWTIQNPAQRAAVDLLAPRPGETVLDACAAPGGKSRQIAAALAPDGGPLACLDLPGPRLDALRAALEPLGHPWLRVAGLDVRTLNPEALAAAGLPRRYQAVLVDAPCSNTGVLQRKPDVKWRLRGDEFAEHAGRQLALLRGAAACVASGGRVVYATCSLEDEENDGVVRAFLAATPGWELREQLVSRPWETPTDGGAAYLLRHVPG